MTELQTQLIELVIADSPYDTAEQLQGDNHSWFGASMISKVLGWSAEKTGGVIAGAQEAGLVGYEPDMKKYGWYLTEKALELAVAKGM
jgi:hypothetical protein